MIYLTNAFSITMIDRRLDRYNTWVPIGWQRITLGKVRGILDRNPDFVSAYGHHATAEHLSWILGRPVRVNRIMIQAVPGDQVIVAAVRNMSAYRSGKAVEPFFDFYLMRFFVKNENERRRNHE